jgi:hypothetical protein
MLGPQAAPWRGLFAVVLIHSVMEIATRCHLCVAALCNLLMLPDPSFLHTKYPNSMIPRLSSMKEDQ